MYRLANMDMTPGDSAGPTVVEDMGAHQCPRPWETENPRDL